MTHTVRLTSPSQRQRAHSLVDKAPAGYVVRIDEPKRTLDQNAKMWAALTDVSRARPNGREMTPKRWKAVFMEACGHEVQFEQNLNGTGFFPTGLSTRELSVAQMSDLIEFILSWGAQNGVKFSDEGE